jgi:L-seryl-tRNA(Ser) seleniumtransferase
VGSTALVQHLRSHPLARALRVDAMTDAALAATLEALAGNEPDEIPFWRMALLAGDQLQPRVEDVANAVGGEVRPGESVIGAGSFPGVGIPTPQVVLEGADHLHARLLAAHHPVLARRQEKDLVIDLRAVDSEDDDLVVEMVTSCR